MQQVAAHPYATISADLTRDWRKEKRREAQENAEQVQP
jgi:hypothetical protein